MLIISSYNFFVRLKCKLVKVSEWIIPRNVDSDYPSSEPVLKQKHHPQIHIQLQKHFHLPVYFTLFTSKSFINQSLLEFSLSDKARNFLKYPFISFNGNVTDFLDEKFCISLPSLLEFYKFHRLIKSAFIVNKYSTILMYILQCDCKYIRILGKNINFFF